MSGTDKIGRAGGIALVVVLGMASCGDLDAATERGKWLANALVANNAQWAMRAPELVAMKFTKMARSPFMFFRGTAALYWHDVLHWQGRLRLDVAGDESCAPFTVLIGDPHVENIGTFAAANGDMFLGFNDFDLADIGPMQADVVRLGVSWFAVGSEIYEGDAALSQQAATAAVNGYAEELASLAAGNVALQDRHWVAGNAVASDELLEKAREKGEAQSKLEDYAPQNTEGERALYFGDVEAMAPDGIWEDTLQPLKEPLRGDVMAAISGYAVLSPDRTQAQPTLDAARRLGAGVASYPADRYYVLWQSPGASAPYTLLEMKETGPGLPLYGMELGTITEPLPGGERVARYQAALSDRADGDAWLGYTEMGALSFRVREVTGYQRGFDVVDLADDVRKGDLSAADIDALAQQAGALLARLHARGALLRSGDALTAQAGRRAAQSLQGCVDGAFVSRTVQEAMSYWAITLADFSVFQAVLESYPEWLRYAD